MKDVNGTLSKVEIIRRYLGKRFSKGRISEARQCAMAGKNIAYGFLIRIEDKEEEFSVFPLKDFLQEIPEKELGRILDEKDLAGFLEKSGKKIVKLDADGFEVWTPTRQ